MPVWIRYYRAIIQYVCNRQWKTNFLYGPNYISMLSGCVFYNVYQYCSLIAVGLGPFYFTVTIKKYTEEVWFPNFLTSHTIRGTALSLISFKSYIHGYGGAVWSFYPINTTTCMASVLVVHKIIFEIFDNLIYICFYVCYHVLIVLSDLFFIKIISKFYPRYRILSSYWLFESFSVYMWMAASSFNYSYLFSISIHFCISYWWILINFHVCLPLLYPLLITLSLCVCVWLWLHSQDWFHVCCFWILLSFCRFVFCLSRWHIKYTERGINKLLLKHVVWWQF